MIRPQPLQFSGRNLPLLEPPVLDPQALQFLGFLFHQLQSPLQFDGFLSLNHRSAATDCRQSEHESSKKHGGTRFHGIDIGSVIDRADGGAFLADAQLDNRKPERPQGTPPPRSSLTQEYYYQFGRRRANRPSLRRRLATKRREKIPGSGSHRPRAYQRDGDVFEAQEICAFLRLKSDRPLPRN